MSSQIERVVCTQIAYQDENGKDHVMDIGAKAENVTFEDGDNFQDKLDAGALNGQPGVDGKDGMACRTAKIVIGAAASGWTENDCDYLCPESTWQNANNAFQSAIDALPDSGGEIILLDGAYSLSVSILITKSNVTIRGNGPSTKVMFRLQGAHFVVSGDHCTFRDMSLYCSPDFNGNVLGGISTSGKYTTAQRISFESGPTESTTALSCGVSSTGVAMHTRILDCNFFGPSYGMYLRGGFELVRGNVFRRNPSKKKTLQVGAIVGHNSIFAENFIVSDYLTGPTITADQGNIEVNNITASEVVTT